MSDLAGAHTRGEFIRREALGAAFAGLPGVLGACGDGARVRFEAAKPGRLPPAGRPMVAGILMEPEASAAPGVEGAGRTGSPCSTPSASSKKGSGRLRARWL